MAKGRQGNKNISVVGGGTIQAPVKAKSPSDIVNESKNRRITKMETFNINGKEVTTNYGAIEYPKLSGYANGYNKVDFGKTDGAVFNELVEQGYTNIRFAEMTTSVRGFHNVYYKATK